MIDGALANPVPVSACRSLGANIVIGIGLNDYGGNATSSNNEISNPRTLKKSKENFIGKLIAKSL